MNIALHITPPPSFNAAGQLEIGFLLVTSTGIVVSTGTAVAFGASNTIINNAIIDAAKIVIRDQTGTAPPSNAVYKVFGGAV